MLYSQVALLFSLAFEVVNAAPVASATLDPFNLNPGYAGRFSSGAPPMLVNTDRGALQTGIPTKAHDLPDPIETAIQPSDHQDGDESIYHLMGNLSPYYKSYFGVYNYEMPDQCQVKQAHYLGRHGSRYPSSPSATIAEIESANFTASGALSFLNEWENKLGGAILTHNGHQQLFDHGVAQYYRYGGLAPSESGKKIVARSTSQQRMKESAMYFLSGFFGLDWEDHANLELVLEAPGQNNTLAYYACANNDASFDLGYTMVESYRSKYLADTVDRLNNMLEGNLTLTASSVAGLQDLCAYETNALGSSQFCTLFTQEEWEGYEYANDLIWYYSNSFGNPTARAVGIGWVQEFYRRITNSPYDPAFQSSENSTLNSNPEYFPTDQNLYFDFTHDSMIVTIFTALGFEQLRSNFTGDGVKQPFVQSQLVPFGAYSVFEIIDCDEKVPADRSSTAIEGSGSTQYVHMIVNDNTLSLPANLPDVCESRADGWCELGKFVEYLETLYDAAEWTRSCFSDIDIAPVTNGVPE